MNSKKYKSHGNGSIDLKKFKKIGKNVIFEKNVLVFHSENISIGNNVYIGHNSTLKAYHKNELTIEDDTWIGQNCFFHSAGGIYIGHSVGIAPNVNILTSSHVLKDLNKPVIQNEINYNQVIIKAGSDIGIGSIIMPGVEIGEGAIVGAGSIVTKSVMSNSVVAGNPAKVIKLKR